MRHGRDRYVLAFHRVKPPDAGDLGVVARDGDHGCLEIDAVRDDDDVLCTQPAGSRREVVGDGVNGIGRGVDESSEKGVGTCTSPPVIKRP